LLVVVTVVTLALGELLSLLSVLLITGRGIGRGLVIFGGGFFATAAFDLMVVKDGGVAGTLTSPNFRFTTVTFLRPPIC